MLRVRRALCAELSKIPTLLFGTINGVIGVVASLPAAQYRLLDSLQAAMRKVVKGVGGFDHAQVGAAAPRRRWGGPGAAVI